MVCWCLWQVVWALYVFLGRLGTPTVWQRYRRVLGPSAVEWGVWVVEDCRRASQGCFPCLTFVVGAADSLDLKVGA